MSVKILYYDIDKQHIKEKYKTDLLGRYHGLREEYREDGSISMRGNYKHNVPHGLFEHFFKNGTMHKEVLKNGQIEGRSEIFKNGKLESFITYHKGKKEGIFEKYWPDGGLNEKGTYHNDLLEGPAELYHKDGSLWQKYTYHLDKKEGEVIEYYEDGSLMSRRIYHRGEIDGVEERLWPNGKLFYRATYINGKIDGPFEAYYENGNLSMKGIKQGEKFAGESFNQDGTKIKKK